MKHAAELPMEHSPLPRQVTPAMQEAAHNGTLKPSFSITGGKRKELSDSTDLVHYSQSQVLPEIPPAIEYPTRLTLQPSEPAQSLSWSNESLFSNSTPMATNTTFIS